MSAGSLAAPFPWYGGKSRVAAEVWSRLGDVAVYAEPFAGSLAVLLGRPEPEWRAGRIETVNDVDGLIANAWRAILHDPDATARAADWPVSENDLHARHMWLVAQREHLVARLEGDPDFFDAKIAGWWLWGIACWIGGEFCSGRGPWHRIERAPGDWQLVRTGGAGEGASRQIVRLGSAGQGVTRRLPDLCSAGRGVTRGLLDLGDGRSELVSWLRALSERLRRVRVCCGDWSRILTPSALAAAAPGTRGVFLDPPYGVDDRTTCYSHDSRGLAADVRAWCVEHGTDRAMRIALCGYEGEGHEVLVREHGWSVHAWTASGGVGRGENSRARANRERERIWFSPACVSVRQLGLFAVP